MSDIDDDPFADTSMLPPKRDYPFSEIQRAFITIALLLATTSIYLTYKAHKLDNRMVGLAAYLSVTLTAMFVLNKCGVSWFILGLVLSSKKKE